eukprot:c12652_g1_i4.p1 GENE.c12652_g1_i4~~c12652_g1_i4.p1  ORF type:complete len:1294 (-),score=313.64 c12652_g1_i4:167-4048(-)
MTLMEQKEYVLAGKTLWLEKEMTDSGVGILFAVVSKWLEAIGVEVPSEFSEAMLGDLPAPLVAWIQHQFSQPIITRFEISGIGGNDHGSVVPDDWLGRAFENGVDCHSQMDQLSWRMGKPPVHYCITPGLLKREIKGWDSDFEEAKRQQARHQMPVVLFVQGKGSVLMGRAAAVVSSWAQTPGTKWRLWQSTNKQVLIVTDLAKDVDTSEVTELKKERVALLASTMQKAIRRGRNNARLVGEVVERLCQSKPYHLPEHQFLRVSAFRQVCWRLFICCVEDASPYVVPENDTSGVLSMEDLVTLAAVCSADSDLILPQSVVSRLVSTAQGLCLQDQVCWDWRKGRADGESKSKSKAGSGNLKYAELADLSPKQRIANVLLAAVELMPMMKGDGEMLKAGARVLRQSLLQVDLKSLPVAHTNSAKASANKDEALTLRAGADMHCFPNMILHVQGALPPHALSTHDVSKFIWDHMSCLNIRYEKHKKILEEGDQVHGQTIQTIQAIQQFYIDGCDLDKVVDSPAGASSSTQNIALAGLLASVVEEEKSRLALPKASPQKSEAQVESNNTADDPTSDIVGLETNRAAFLMLFGRPVVIPKSKSYPRMEVLCAGMSVQQPFIVRESRGASQEMRLVQDEDQIQAAVDKYYEITSEPTTVAVSQLKGGFVWRHWDKKQAQRVKIRTKGPGVFEAAGIETTVLDGSVFVKSVDACPCEDTNVGDKFKQLVKVMTSQGGWDPVVDCWKGVVKGVGLTRCYDWSSLVVAGLAPRSKNDASKKQPKPAATKTKTITSTTSAIQIAGEVWRGVYAQLHREVIEFGPVDRQGNKLQRAISYMDEGFQWRLVLLLGVLYPGVVTMSGPWKINVDHNHSKYSHMIAQVRKIVEFTFVGTANPEGPTPTAQAPCVLTKLWDHQLQSVRRMVEGMVKYNKRGFGDASHVGAGKTLTALATMAELYPKREQYGGFLVLVPNLQLIQTWKDEITKHTKGINVVVQNANGSLTGEVHSNSIVLSSMGRCREHPLLRAWILVVIDECLSVQNKEALQTEEAWRQCLLSKFGVCMLSATFFRSRFDKLFYMLQMLQTPFPCQKEYLDLILTEHILCHLASAENARVWNTTTHKFELSPQQRQDYNRIQQMRNNQNDKDMYVKLTKFVTDNVNYPALFISRLKEIQGKDNRCLIYAKSKAEAERIAELGEGEIGVYPDKSNRHVVVSFSAGTFGLNDLVMCDTILTRPPEPDKLPQMKGRLDRPGQKSRSLKLEMILVANTVEEAWLLRLEMAMFFFRRHIMPLAEFYKNAVEYC